MNQLKIACIGDIMCGESFYALGQGVASSLGKYGKHFLRPEIVNYFSSHDLVLCNVECVLSNKGRKDSILRSVQMRGRPTSAKYLADWGVTVANVANNHILEHGYDAAVETVNLLQSVGIQTIGAGKNGTYHHGIQIAEMSCRGQKLAILGICLCNEKYAFNGGAELDETIEMVKFLVRRNRIVIVSVHWGDELMDRPNVQQQRIARSLINAGVTLIVGHHPHVVQGIEIFNGGLVAYSLGNFIFDSFIEDTKWSNILSVTISGRRSIKWQCVPIKRDKEHRPELVTGENKAKLECEIKRRCDLLELKMSDHCYHKRYQSDFTSRDVRARRKLYFELLKRSLYIKLIYWPQILWRPIQRRIGMW